MAYASLLSLTRIIETETILPHHLDDYEEDAIQSLFASLKEKANFLLSFLDISPPINSNKIRGLEARIRDAAYEAEDIIIKYQKASYQYQYQYQILSDPGVDEECHKTESYMFYQMVKYHTHLQRVIEKLTSVSEHLMKMKENNEIQLPQPSNSSTAASSRYTHSTPKKVLHPIGFEAQHAYFIDRLTAEYSDELKVIVIVGMAGQGKTTFARSVYRSPRIAHHFETRARVTVTQEYQVREVLKRLLSSIRNHNLESGQEISTEKLAQHITKILKDKRYLIVLDNVLDFEAFYQIIRFFPDNNNGSCILLTARYSSLGTLADVEEENFRYRFVPYHLRVLSSHESRNLLHVEVFRREGCPPELELLAEKIAIECRGLPFALAIVGGLLGKGDRTLDYWEYSARNISSVIGHHMDRWIPDLLSFIYNQLPHHLKACFLYMGVLPEDYGIRRSKLIMLWVASEFIKPDTVKTLEEVAEEYLNDLIDRNLIMIRELGSSGEIKRCNINNVTRDFCIMKAKEEKFLRSVNRHHVDHFPDVTKSMRHLSIHTELNPGICTSALAHDYSVPIRSVLFFSDNSSKNVSDLIASFQQLRVLDLIAIMFNGFPVEIVEMVTLRFVALTFWVKHRIPASISKLCNLETLIVNPGKFRSIFNTTFLPPEIWKMKRLRHLLFVRSIVPYPNDMLNGTGFVPLENLQTIGNVINFTWTKEAVELMPNLKKLVITYEHDGRTQWSSYSFNNFVYLHQLQILKCFFFGKSYLKCQDPLPVNFAFPRELKRLSLSGCRISWENITAVGSLPNLEVLKLKFHAFEGPLWESKDGQFSQLKLLLLHMIDLEQWKVEETHFRQLERLSLRYCYNLVEIPYGIGRIPTLQEIELCECSQHVVTSAKVIEEEQHAMGNDEFKVVLKKGEDTDIAS